jgi:hypothetical protein
MTSYCPHKGEDSCKLAEQTPQAVKDSQYLYLRSIRPASSTIFGQRSHRFPTTMLNFLTDKVTGIRQQDY